MLNDVEVQERGVQMRPKLLVAALTHRDEVRLERLIRSLEGQYPSRFDWGGVVICNTTDETYPEKARQVAERHDWTFIRTPSNGMPGMGKNSVISIFSQLDGYDYLLMMDGDDLLYPCALQQLEALVRTGADVVGLLTNDIVDRTVYEDQLRMPVSEDTFLYSWFDDQMQWNALPEFANCQDLSRPLGEQRTTDRIILLSRRASWLRCSEKLPVYEDYTLSLQAQAACFEGELNYVHTGSTYIYLYDKTNEQSTCKVFDRSHNGNWSAYDAVFREEIQGLMPFLEGRSSSDVPFAVIKKPTNFDTQAKLDFVRNNFHVQ